jgi:Fe2+ transport system protein FeoA
MQNPAVIEIIPLETLVEGQRGCIVDLSGPLSWKHRMEEMGLREGTFVRLVKRGQPCIIAIEDRRLSLRGDPSSLILVEVVPAESTMYQLNR